jgi:ribosomal protein S19E (S16A)
MKDDLSATEFDWLRQIAEASPQLIPSAIAERLRQLGYIEQFSTGHRVTPKGRKRLAKGPPAR